MSSFLNIRSSCPEVSEKGVLKFLRNSLKNVRDAVFNLKFYAKRSATLQKKLLNKFK